MNDQSVEVVMIKRIKGGWDKENYSRVNLSVEEVGKMIADKWGKNSEQLFKDTKIGEWIMLQFYGTFSKIADCYKAAGNEVYQEWLHKRS